MITIISPTTTMDFTKKVNIKNSSNPFFIEEANYLISILKNLKVDEIRNLMNLSEDLGKLNFERYNNYSKKDNLRAQSILAFDGEVFSCANIHEFNEDDFDFANTHFKILSGLYGVLSPYDIIEPYRLEMKSKFKNNSGDNLYKFWKEKITNKLCCELENQTNKILVNLASSEYLKCIDLKTIRSSYSFVDVVFKDYHPSTDSYKVKGMYSKQARGYMLNYIIKNKIDIAEDLKLFNEQGYTFNESLSSEESFVFTRK
ncbi:YaaA family protein [Romboutsia weinsteinii]|uniref:UPF0246 protein CHL78_005685 n=1 Tax=Romboutsia weinsteinii TaxID=2020949 RepID=A0A371J6K9_9FIRM|nr:YaaA family protein [Romboutsia weinsteinii]RDY28392.1 YaaA family protein [Romboutsia weinsteinii]